MGSAYLPVLIPTPRRAARQRHWLWGAALASLVGGSALLPAVWSGLAGLQTLPHWAPAAQHLAQAPLAAWALMLVWTAAVPLCLLATLWAAGGWRGRLLTAALGALAAAWYLHMPALQQCSALYGERPACAFLQSAYQVGIGLAVAAGLFALCVLVLRGLGLLSPGQGRSDALELHRYGA